MIENITSLIEEENIDAIIELMEQEGLELKDGKIVPINSNNIQEKAKFWDQNQLVKKIGINSVYGICLQPSSQNFDQRLGQSCTLSGRCTTRHMGSYINNKLTERYELGDAIMYGDSVHKDSIIRTSDGPMTIEELFNSATLVTQMNGKEYAYPNLTTFGLNSDQTPISFVVRHKTNKQKWMVITSSQKRIIVTNDHSVMIEQDDNLLEVKPEDLKIGDIVLTINQNEITRETILEAYSLGNFDNEYVYDLSVKEGPTVFFANDILVKNTDSIFYTIPKENKLNINPETMTKEDFIEISGNLADEVNASFPAFYKKTFNVPEKQAKVIECGREMCVSSALFIKKKRYSALYFYDDKGIRYDKGNRNGKLKIMGLEIKRADCPEWVQDKLEETLYYLLDKKSSEEQVLEFIREWRKEFLTFEPWQMGIPKRVNNLTHYTSVHVNKTKGITIPGHARASINWNEMREANNDIQSMKISDGQKVIVCQIHKNVLGLTTVAYPIDQQFLPDWFKNLNFNVDLMVEKAVDDKIKNIFGILDWDLENSKVSDQFHQFFEFE